LFLEQGPVETMFLSFRLPNEYRIIVFDAFGTISWKSFKFMAKKLIVLGKEKENKRKIKGITIDLWLCQSRKAPQLALSSSDKQRNNMWNNC
jgi:hypothetical protein